MEGIKKDKISYKKGHNSKPLFLILTFKAPRKITEQTTIYFYFLFFSEKIMLDMTCESSAKQTIHM